MIGWSIISLDYEIIRCVGMNYTLSPKVLLTILGIFITILVLFL